MQVENLGTKVVLELFSYGIGSFISVFKFRFQSFSLK